MSNTATKETTDLHPDMVNQVDAIDEHVRKWSDTSTGTDQTYVSADYEASAKARVAEADMDSNPSLDASDVGTAMEDADVETKTDTALDDDYDIARDEIYETDLLGDDSDLDQDRDPAGSDAVEGDAQDEDSSGRSAGDGSG